MLRLGRIASPTNTPLRLRTITARFASKPTESCLQKKMMKTKGASSPKPEPTELAERISKLVRKSGCNALRGANLTSKLTPLLANNILLKLKPKGKLALWFFNWMNSQRGFKHTTQTYCTIITILVKAKIYRPAQELMKVVAVIAPQDSLEIIIKTLDKTSSKCKCDSSGVVLDMLFRTYADAGMIEEAYETFRHMKVRGSKPDGRACNTFLVALRKAVKADIAWKFFYEMLEQDIAPSVHSLSIMTDALCREGKVQRAIGFIEEMRGRGFEPNVYTYNSLIDWYTTQGVLSKAFDVLETFSQEGVCPNAGTYTLLIKGLCNLGKLEEAKNILNEMQEKGVDPDVVTYTPLIGGHCKAGDMREAFKLHDEMLGRGLVPNLFTYSVLINGLCKLGQMEGANIILREMQSKGVDPNEVMITLLT